MTSANEEIMLATLQEIAARLAALEELMRQVALGMGIRFNDE
jgi:hypothetical protein